jgi:hypothetical protein
MMAMWTTFNIDDEDFSKFVPGVANQPKFRLEKGWAVLTALPSSLPLTNESLKRMEDEALDEEFGRALSTER